MSLTVLKLSSPQARSVLSLSSSADDDLALVRGHRGEDLLGHAGATASVLQLNSHSNKCMLSPKKIFGKLDFLFGTAKPFRDNYYSTVGIW